MDQRLTRTFEYLRPFIAGGRYRLERLGHQRFGFGDADHQANDDLDTMVRVAIENKVFTQDFELITPILRLTGFWWAAWESHICDAYGITEEKPDCITVVRIEGIGHANSCGSFTSKLPIRLFKEVYPLQELPTDFPTGRFLEGITTILERRRDGTRMSLLSYQDGYDFLREIERLCKPKKLYAYADMARPRLNLPAPEEWEVFPVAEVPLIAAGQIISRYLHAHKSVTEIQVGASTPQMAKEISYVLEGLLKGMGETTIPICPFSEPRVQDLLA